MVLPAQFQLGLELTNIVNPISQAMSALGSLAVIDAIKKSGSDFITETKLASLIGRHRIDPVINFHFREMVAKSDQSVISRYLDIILESGSGPTVQEALKNPALFSMVIQLSALTFAHDDESLANTIVEAIEKIVLESNGDVGIVPDYASLLGTLRACQQQTAAFRWALLYEAAEERIRKALDTPDTRSSQRENPEHHGFHEFGKLDQSRALPVPVMQGLFMWLQSLQSFPEHRLLHLRCYTGISTIVVWCHHVLGLSLLLNIEETKIGFGNAPYNLVVEQSQSQKAGVSLMDPLDPYEPLFTLQNVESGIEISYEHRAEACGYGTKYLRFKKIPDCERYAQWVISYCIERCEALDELYRHDFGLRYPSRTRLMTAGRFIFALDESVKSLTPNSTTGLELVKPEILKILIALADIVITFARISEDDLAKCIQMPLALNAVHMISNNEITETDHKNPRNFFGLLESFETLSLMLLHCHIRHENYIKRAFLVSAWGWSVFLDSIDSIDPSDVSIDTLRVLRGVPSRRGIRKTRIIDGPQETSLTKHFRSFGDEDVDYFVAKRTSMAQKGVILVGHHDDAFEVTQQFTLYHERTYTHRLGFREMAQLSIRSSRLPPCHCPKSHNNLSQVKVDAIDKLLREKDGVMQRISLTENDDEFSDPLSRPEVRGNHFVYVSDNPAARWLQLQLLYSDLDRKGSHNRNIMSGYYIGLRGQNTCVHCAIRNSELLPPRGIFLL